MPVSSGIIGAESPPKIRPGNALQNMGVPRHVIWIVEIDETILKGWSIENDIPGGEQDREAKHEAALRPRR
jgi:hypothetical protein